MDCLVQNTHFFGPPFNIQLFLLQNQNSDLTRINNAGYVKENLLANTDAGEIVISDISDDSGIESKDASDQVKYYININKKQPRHRRDLEKCKEKNLIVTETHL